MNVGWECPKCGAVYAPFISQCYRCAPRPLGLTIYPSAPAPGTTGAPMPEPMRVTCGPDIGPCETVTAEPGVTLPPGTSIVYVDPAEMERAIAEGRVSLTACGMK